MWVNGLGNIICYNRIRHWKDGMDVDESIQCVGCDLHNNDMSECFDDGCEMDGSDRNNRNYDNRYTNALTGVSLQPIHGGPVYVFRNVMYNAQTEAFKLHNNPSGAIMFQNTFVKNGGPLLVCGTSRSISNCHAWNNLYLGQCMRAADYDTPLFDCTFDYNGFGGFNPAEQVFMKWAGVTYHSLAELRKKSPYESHCIIVDPGTAFASGLRVPADHLHIYDNTIVDLRLNPDCAAVGAGQIVPGYETGPGGSAPSLARARSASRCRGTAHERRIDLFEVQRPLQSVASGVMSWPAVARNGCETRFRITRATMVYKPDFENAQERIKASFKGEILDRLVIRVAAIKDRAPAGCRNTQKGNRSHKRS